MKAKILFIAALLISVSMSAINFDTIGAGVVSNASKSGGTIEDTVSNALGTSYDEISFINKLKSGSQEVSVKIKNPDLGNINSEAGLMIRESVSPGSPFLAVVVNGNRTLKIKERWYQGGFTSTRMTKITRKSANFWIKIVKQGQVNPIYIKYSKNGAWEHLDNGVFMPLASYYAGVTSSGGFGSTGSLFDYRQFKITAIAARLPQSAQVDQPTEGVTIYPNPARERVTIEANFTPERVAIFAADGRRVRFIESLSTPIDISGLPAGVYYVRADGVTRRFIKIN